jgi:type IV pilus modification protein PilV
VNQVEGRFQIQSRNRSHGEEGLTIIEVLIALVILSVGVLAVAKLQTLTVSNTTKANVITQATMLAQTRMDTLKNFEDLIQLDLENGNVETDIDEFGNPGGIFTRTTSVSTMPAPVSGLARRIQVTVTWQSLWPGHRQVILSSVTQGNGI